MATITTANCTCTGADYDYPWPQWTATAAGVSDTTATVTYECWPHWAGNTATITTNAVADFNAVWVQWANNAVTICNTRPTPQPTPPETPEQRAAREAAAVEQLRLHNERNARMHAEFEAEKKALAEAEVKARELLLMCLSAAQKKTLAELRYFDIMAGAKAMGKAGKTTKYRIHEGTHGNVSSLNDDDMPNANFCIQPVGVPQSDAMLAQKLMLETDEAEFLRIANKTTLTALRA